MSSPRLIRLRYRGSCHLCGLDLAVGAKAWWDGDDHTATCINCELEHPADPFGGVDPGLRGVAGGSAQAEYKRRVERSQTSSWPNESWKKGAEGERHLSSVLQKEAIRSQVTVLDDRLIPGSRANIDHIVIAPSGIYVIDAKNYSGAVHLKTQGFGRRLTQHLMVKGRDRTKLAVAMVRQTDAVRAALQHLDSVTNAPIVPVLCFVGSENWRIFDSKFMIGNVHVLWPKALVKLLRREGSLDIGTRQKVARLLSTQLLPAVA